MYTIHALVNSKCVPLVYSFLPRKTQVIYEKFLQIIAEKLSKVPKSLTIDFELAFLNACMIIFPGVPMYLCFFHFSQSMWRKIQEIGLQARYVESDEMRYQLKLPTVLAFIPPDDVESVFLSQKSKVNDPQVLEFYEYFETNYVGKTTLEASSTRKNARKVPKKHEPLFKVELWNVYYRLNNDIPRTNNFCEAWHNAFSSMLNSHPLIYKLIDALRREQQKTEAILIKLKTGASFYRKNKYIEYDERLKNINSVYSKVDFESFYERMCLLIKY